MTIEGREESRVGDRRNRGKFPGDRVITHDTNATRLAEWVAANPAVRQVGIVSTAPTYLVGGVVRDLLRGGEVGPDIDITVEGPVDGLARRMASDLSADVTIHDRFLTAEVVRMDGACLDLATARSERYGHPGALPEVAPAGIETDLARRDFTINALAFGLAGPHAGALLDPHEGIQDLEAGVIRTIRPGSFPEDPSRLVRAARYAARLGYVLAPETAAEAREASTALDIGSARVGDELRRLLCEPTAADGLSLLAGLGVPWLADLGDRVALREQFSVLDQSVRHAAAPSVGIWPMRLGLCVSPASIERMELSALERDTALGAGRGADLADRLGGAPMPSDVDRILTRETPSAQVSALLHGATIVTRWWIEWRESQLRIAGDDLVAAGIPEGPAIGHALATVRAALLDGRVADDRSAQLAQAIATRGREEPS